MIKGSTDGSELYHHGHPWDIVDEMARQGMELNDPGWREGPYFKTNSVVECVEIVQRGIDEWLAGLGYVREGLYYRHTISEENHRTIALFCHGGSSSAAIGHILNIPFPYVCAMLHMEFTGITILRFDRHAGAGTLPCSAGTEKNSRMKLTPGLIGWADMIFCFEKKHLRRLKDSYVEEIAGKTVITMNIPDEYEYMDEELQEIRWSYAEEYQLRDIRKRN